MNSPNLYTAVLYFSRSAKAEQAAKPLIKGPKGQAWNEDLIQHGLAIARQSDLPVFWISEEKQKGNSFGERFSNAFEEIFNFGYERVISIGNDCLTLTSQDILQASESLESSDWVLGPSTDGGTYLIGINQSSFEKDAFENLSWETSDLWEDLTKLIYANSEDFTILSPKSDIDYLFDLKANLQNLRPFQYLFRWLNRLFYKIPQQNFDSRIITNNALISHPQLRGPPAI